MGHEGKGGDLLKAVPLNASLRYCSSFGKLVSVVGYGSVCGFGCMVGVGFTLVGDSTCVLSTAATVSCWYGMGWGKHNDMARVSLPPALLKYTRLTLSQI